VSRILCKNDLKILGREKMASSDYKFGEEIVISFEKALQWQKAIYMGVGMNEKDAETVADHLVTADARGVYSHGIMRTPIYVRRFEEKGTSLTAQPEVVKVKGSTALVDGKNSMGMVATAYGMNVAIDLARQYGSSTVSVTGSNHLGTCAYYAEMAAKENMIGYCWTINCGNIMAPWGGIERQLGNNPFAIAAPCLTKPPVVLDMATSVVARGKIVMAMKTGAEIPETWAFDQNGKPTTDAEAGYWGTVRPFGDYKGYGLTFMNAILSAVLNGSSFGPTITDLYEEPERVQNTGHLLQVIDISAISDVNEFKKRMDDAVDYLKNGKKAEGVSEIFVPGELEASSLERQLREGISYPVEVIEENKKLAEKYGVKFII
jgi:LDH2 family malate/lactate/ureidoglycolate dehydrogenase